MGQPIGEFDRWKELYGDCSPELYEKWLDWAIENPAVGQLFLRFAREAKQAGRVRFSGWMIANRIRWYTAIETKGDDFKISNDFIALYTRWLMYNHPEEFGDFFVIKKMDPNRSVAKTITEDDVE